MGKLVNDTLRLGDELGKLEEQTGITVPTLDRLRQAADLAGVDFGKVSKSFGIFAENMMDFQRGKGMAFDALEQLQISPTFINERGVEQLKEVDELLFEVAEALYNLPSGSTLEGIDLAKTIFGGQGMKMIPLLNMGKEAIMDLDTAFTGDFADRIEDFNDSMAQLGEKFNFLKFSLTESLLPALELAVDAFTKVAEFLKSLPKPIQSAIVAFGLLAPAIIALAPGLAAIIVSFKILAKIKIATVLAGVVAKFGALKAGVIAGAAAFAPFLPGALIGAAIIGLGVLIFKFKDQIISGFETAGEFIVNFFIGVKNFIGNVINNIREFFKPFTNFIGNIFNNAMDLARNAFNRLPNIVQEAIKFATAPLRNFIKFVEKILSLLGRVKGSKIETPKTTVSSSTTRPTSNVLSNTPRSTSTSSSSLIDSLPKSNDYAFPGQDMSIENVGAKYGIDYSSQSIPSSNSLVTTQLPSGGYSITNAGTGKPKPPNINIQTGNVVQMDNTNYVTTNQLQNAVQSATTQTMNYLQAGGVTYYLP